MLSARNALAILAFAAAAGLIFVPGCKKTPPEAHSAPAVVEPAARAGATAAPATGGAPAGGKEDSAVPPGVDLSKLDDFERKVFFRIVNKEASACGGKESLIASAKNDKSCRKSFYALRYVARLVDQGYTDSEISEALGKRYRGVPAKNIDVGDAPTKGNPAARVTLVEFADYECPHCKRLQPVLRQVLDEYRNDVRLFFKHYPLPQHDHATAAAEAAIAAHRQGKFWPFDDKLWANQESLGAADVEKYAKESGLDLGKWRKDLEDPAIKDRVNKDRADGKTLGLQSTPTVYINGREYTDPRDFESIKDWIDEELGR